MSRYMPFVYGSAAALFLIRAMARGTLGTAAQSYYNEVFVGTAPAGGENQ